MTTVTAAWRLLTGSLSDAEYFRSLEADRFGLFYDVPRPGWATRRRRLFRAFTELVGLIVGLLCLVAILWMVSIPMPGR
jgi:hypothetical protein